MNGKSLLTFILSIINLLMFGQIEDAQVNLFAIPTLSTSFVRMPSRNASQEIDAVYYNPAGVLSLKNGFHLNVNNQFQWIAQNLKVTKNHQLQEQPETNYPFTVRNYAFPILYGAYVRQKKFSIAFMVTPAVGGGGAASIKNLPFGEFPIADFTALSKELIHEFVDKPCHTNYSDIKYDYDFDFTGLSYSPSIQTNFAFKINKYFDAAFGLRFLYYIVNAKGGLSNLTFNNETLGISKSPSQYIIDMGINEVDCVDTSITNLLGHIVELFPLELEINAKQTGLGFTPILGLNFNYNRRWFIGLKYEHRTHITLTTKVPDPTKNGAGVYEDGRKQASDFPGMFTSGVTFKPNNRLTLAIGNRLFFFKRANFGGREQYIKSNYKEFDAAFEYRVMPRLKISAGGTYRTVRLDDEYYTSIDYFLPALTIAGGFKVEFSQRIEIEAGLLITKFLDRYYVQDVGIFGGLLPNVGIELPPIIDESFSRRIDYEMSGLVYYASVGVNFWMGSIEENQKGRAARIASIKMIREENQIRRENRHEKRKDRHD